MTDFDEDAAAPTVVTRPGIGSEQAQRAAAAATKANRVRAEPGNVVSLANNRLARGAADFLARTFNRVAWVSCVHVGYASDGAPVIVMMAAQPPSEMDRGCAPTGVNNFAVEIRVGRCRRAHPGDRK